MSQKLLVILLLFVGESAFIYLEMLGAKMFTLPNVTFWNVFAKLFLFSIVFASLVLSGYILGFKAFNNIWIVSVISITSILITEPILAYKIFHQLPTKGAWLGLCLGVIGLFSALFWE